METCHYFTLMLVLLYHSDVIHAECGGDMYACEPPPFDEFLSFTPEKLCYTEGDEINYSCSLKGHMGGPLKNLCVKGKWGFPTPTCEGFICQKPDIDTSVTLIPNKETFEAREKVEYVCTNGNSILEGPIHATCEKGGWNPRTTASCSVMCDKPTVEHGTVHTHTPTKKGDSIKVKCDDGYVIPVGDSQRITCGDGGMWEHIPRCIKM